MLFMCVLEEANLFFVQEIVDKTFIVDSLRADIGGG